MIRVAHKSGAQDGSGGTSLTIANIQVFGGNPLLVVMGTSRGGSVTAVSWNGNAFTKAVEHSDATTFTEHASIWYLVPPAPGTYDVVLTLGGDFYIAQSILLNDAAQSSPLDTTGSQDRTAGTELNPSLTTGNDNELVLQAFGSIVSNSGAAQLNGINWNDGQTLLGELYFGPLSSCFASGYKFVSTAAATDLKAQMRFNGNIQAQEDIVTVSAAFKQQLSPQPNAAFLMQLIPNLE